jgi:hypothetical protein
MTGFARRTQRAAMAATDGRSRRRGITGRRLVSGGRPDHGSIRRPHGAAFAGMPALPESDGERRSDIPRLRQSGQGRPIGWVPAAWNASTHGGGLAPQRTTAFSA